MQRRDFLKTASAATLGALAAKPQFSAAAENANAKLTPKADTCILLWMAGGMAHTETFDPKRHSPFKKGMKATEIASTFPSIRTAVDGVRFSQHLDHLAKVMDRGTLIRSHIVGDLGKILHSRHQFHWHTGYEPPLTVAAPHIGAWMAKALGPKNKALPAFIDIGQPYAGNGEAEELKAFQTAGFLGSEFGPFRIPDPSQAINTVRPPKGMSMKRFRRRRANYLKLLKASPLYREAGDYQRQSLLRSLESAHRLLDSPAAKAFDLSAEPKKSYDAYNTGRFGQGVLLARRLTEAGARFIEVSSEYIPFKYWDTHDNGHTRLTKLKQMIDRPIAQLVIDLEARKLLNRTLIVLASEFSRSVLIEGKVEKPVPGQVKQPNVLSSLKEFGMHRHFTGAGSVLMFGGGVKKGHVHGVTSPKPPCTTIKDPVPITNLHATILHQMGISPKYHATVEKRPFYATKDGKGAVVDGVLDA